MLRDRVAPLFVGFFGLMAVGMALRRSLRAPLTADLVVAALTVVIVDVTAPLLVVDVLLRARLAPALFASLAPATAGLFASMALARLAGSALKLERPALGAVMLCASFSNTGFMGVPVAQGLYPSEPHAAQAAVIVDTFDTTLLLWTFGAALAARLGASPAGAPEGVARMLLKRPITWAVFLGLPLNLLGVALPAWLRPGVERAGAATGPLVFLLLGLSVDVGRLRGRAAPLAVTVALKLGAAPAVAFATCLALGLRGPAAWAGVLQAAMPTALVATVLAARGGCDGALASAAGALGMLVAPLTLPLWIAAVDAWLR